MKRLTVILILIGFFFLTGCIVKKHETKKAVAPEKVEVAKVTAAIPEKTLEPRREPFVKPAPLTKLEQENEALRKQLAEIEATTEKPKELEDIKGQIAELKEEIKSLSAEKREIRRYPLDESIHAEVKTEQEEPEEPVYYEPVVHYWRPLISPIWLDFALNPFWSWYYWDWYYTGLCYYSYLWGWHPWWYWTRPLYYSYYPYYSYYYGHYGDEYNPSYHGGRTVINKSQLKDPHYQSRNLRSSAISSSGLGETSQISKTSIKGYPSRIASRDDRSISQKQSSTATGYPVKPRSYASDSRFSRSPSASREMSLRPNSFSGAPPRTGGSFRSVSPSHSFSRPSGSFRSVGSFRSSSHSARSSPSIRSSSSVRSAPSRSSGSIRRK